MPRRSACNTCNKPEGTWPWRCGAWTRGKTCRRPRSPRLGCARISWVPPTRWLARRPRGALPVGRSPRQPAQAAVEFALVLPLFLLITAGTIEFGRGFLAYAQLMQSAQSGTRFGAVLGHARDTSDIVRHVQQTAPGGTNDD